MIVMTAMSCRVLTLAPHSWTVKKNPNFFGELEYLFRQAKEIRKNQGVLEQLPRKSHEGISMELQEKVRSFYESDEVSQMCPGKKDYVSVKNDKGDRVKMQKRLLFANLKKNYVLFKKEHDDKLGFSTFCRLRPKWCVMAGRSGTYSVCVCTIHQNVKLMLSAISVKIHYKDLLQMCVCNISNKECMIGHCSSCLGTNQLKTFIINSLLEKYNDDDSICYMQWENTDCCYLIDHELNFEDFIDKFIKKLVNLMSHHYIAEHQSIFFKSC